jgi:hypothetical protein
MKKVLMFTALLMAGFAVAQDKPKLKPEVALELRNAQWESAKLAMQMKSLEQQYTQLQQKAAETQKTISDKMATALERSGIDPKKYELNADTLDVTPKPEPKK